MMCFYAYFHDSMHTSSTISDKQCTHAAGSIHRKSYCSLTHASIRQIVDACCLKNTSLTVLPVYLYVCLLLPYCCAGAPSKSLAYLLDNKQPNLFSTIPISGAKTALWYGHIWYSVLYTYNVMEELPCKASPLLSPYKNDFPLQQL